MRVTFLQTTASGQEPIGSAVLTADGAVRVRVPGHLRATMAKVYVGKDTFTPKDGVAYLRALPVAFSGSLLRARLDP